MANWLRSTVLFQIVRTAWRQWPCIFPRRTIFSAVDWIDRRNNELGWYARRLGPWCRVLYERRPTLLPPEHPPAVGCFDGEKREKVGVTAFELMHSWLELSAGLFFLPETYVYSSDGVVISSQNEIFNEFSHGWSFDCSRRRPYYQPFSTYTWKIREVRESAAVLAVPGAISHYHWLLQALPRIHLLDEVLAKDI